MSKQIPAKSRLGRGLSSLINTASAGAGAVEAEVGAPTPGETAGRAADGGPSAAPAGTGVLEVPLDSIVPNPHQPRRRFEETALKELADSMKTTGLIQPIVARVISDGRYELIAGERRWRAARLAGLATLPVILRNVDPVMQAQMALIENLQRQDLNPIERGSAYKALLDNLGLTHAELADRLGEERSVIGHHVRLLELDPVVQEMVADGRLLLSHARVLAGVSDLAEQARLARLAESQGLSVKNLERLMSAPVTTPPPAADDAAKATSAHLADLEKQLSRQLGMRIQVKAGRQKGKGRLILHFANLDQFDDLMGKLGVKTDD